MITIVEGFYVRDGIIQPATIPEFYEARFPFPNNNVLREHTP
jgi:hypothetical protein